MDYEKMLPLICRVQKEDPEAINELFGAIYNDIYYFALKTVKDPDLAADVTQEALIAIFKDIKKLEDPKAFPAWSRKITFHQCTRHFRKNNEITLSEDEEGGSLFDTIEEEKVDFIPDAALDQQDFRRIILNMIDTLSEEQRSAVLMYYFEELSVGEIAEIQGVSEGTVKSRLNYARKAIKASVEAYEEKNGIKLHSLALLPILRWTFAGEKATTAAAAAAEKATIASAVGASAAGSSAGASSAGASAAGGGIMAKMAALPMVAKVVAGVTAVVLVAGGATLALLPPKEPLPDEGGQILEGAIESEDQTVDYEGVRYCSDSRMIDGEYVTGWRAIALLDSSSVSAMIPAAVEGKPVFGFDSSFSESAKNLRTVEVRCKRIDFEAFDKSNKLEKVVIGAEVEVVLSCFNAKETLSTIIIEDGNQRISEDVFFETEYYNNPANWSGDLLLLEDMLIGLDFNTYGTANPIKTSVVVPEGVTYIASGLFQNIAYKVFSVSIPSTVNRGLEDCIDFYTKEIKISPENPVYHVSGNCVIETAAKKLVQGTINATIPADGSVTVIGANAFHSVVHGEEAYDGNLDSWRRTLVLPEGIRVVEDSALYCDEFVIPRLPDSLETIGKGAFGCIYFEECVLPASLQSVGDGAFYATNFPQEKIPY